MESFQFPEWLLEKAKTITLAQMLDSPVSQCWIVSALSNSHSTLSYHNAKDLEAADELMAYKIRDIVQAIPYGERKTLFDQCYRVIEDRRAKKRAADEVTVVITPQ